MKCPVCRAEHREASRYCPECGTALADTPKTDPAPPSDTQTLPPFFELETGSFFANRYQVIEKIGAGGMGRVYKVVDTKIRERIALKLLKPEISSDERILERFRNEIRLARRISHKNVCRMFDLGEYQRLTYLTMELVPGESLKNIIRMTGPLSVATAVGYAKQICAGLEEAHRWDIVHRDLKPQNILIDPTGTVRIMDFGIARLLHVPGQTDRGIAVGTPEYMSPEQAEGEKVDGRSDIYSLGIILYEMLTGKVPFEGDTTLGLLRKQQSEIPIPPKDRNPQIPERLNRLILKCLEKLAERRYQTVTELLQDLTEIATTDTTVPKIKPRASATLRRVRSSIPVRRFAGVGFTLAVLAIGGYLLVLKPRSDKRSAPTAREETAGSSSVHRLAVLPIEIGSENPDQGNLGLSLAEGIRMRLQGVELDVISPYTSEKLKKSGSRLDECRKYRIDSYLEGTGRVTGDLLTIAIHLVNGLNDSLRLNREYTEKITRGLDGLEDRISSDVARVIGQPIRQGQWDGLQKQGSAVFDAVLANSNGKKAEARYRNTADEKDFQDSLRFFRRAIDLDPNFCRAFVNLGDLYEGRFVETRAEADLKAMIDAYRKAFDLDPDIPEVHAGLGWAYFHQNKLDGAYAAFKRAIALGPRNGAANVGAGSFLRSIGLDKRALSHYELALELDPSDYMKHLFCMVSYWYLGDYVNAARRITEALALEPDTPLLHLYHARLLISMNRLDEADAALRRAEDLSKLNSEVLRGIRTRRALILALRGEREAALSAIRGETQPYRYEMTNIYIVLGMKDEAVRFIKQGNDEGFELVKDYLYPYPYLLTNPFFDPLREDPRFRDILRKEKKAFDAKSAKYGDL